MPDELPQNIQTNPFYSIGCRLIDAEGTASIHVIQILDDQISISPAITCGNITCSKSLVTKQELQINSGGKIDKLDLSHTKQVIWPNSCRCDIINTDTLNVSIGNANTPTAKLGIGTYTEDNTEKISIVHDRTSGNLEILNDGYIHIAASEIFHITPEPTKITGYLLAKFLCGVSNCGGIGLFYGTRSGTSTAQQIIPVGSSLNYSYNRWRLASIELSALEYCGLYLESGMIKYWKPASSPATINTAYKFRTLIPTALNGNRGFLILAMRTE